MSSETNDIREIYTLLEFGKFEDGLILTEEKLQLESKAIKNVEILILKSFILYNLGHYPKVEETLKQIGTILSELTKDEIDQDKKKELELAYNCIKMVTQFKTSTESVNDLIDIIDGLIKNEIDTKIFLFWKSFALYGLGVKFIMDGSASPAIEYYEKSLELAKKINNKMEIIRSKISFCAAYYFVGDINNALENGLSALQMMQELGLRTQLPQILNNLGLIYFARSELDKAFEYFSKSIIESKKINHKLSLCLNYMNIIRTCLLMNKIDEANSYLEKFEQIVEPNQIYQNFLFRLSKAFILKETMNIQDLSQAEKLLNELIKEPSLDSQFTILALFNLIEFKLMEYELLNDENSINKIVSFINQVKEIGISKNLSLYYVQSMILESQLELLMGNFNKSKDLAQKAQKIAKENGIINLNEFAKGFLKDLSAQEELWKKFPEVSLKDRITNSNIKSLIRQMANNQLASGFNEIHTPLIILIFNQVGQMIYSRKFKSFTSQVNDFLLSSFISAIFSFGSEIKTNSKLERIQYQDSSILIKTNEDIIFSYIYSGNTFSAIKKFEKFIDLTLEISDLKILSEELKKGSVIDALNDKVVEIIETVVNEIFPD